MYIYTIYYNKLAIVCAWASVEVWLCSCNCSIASINNAKSSDISSAICYPTRDLLRRLGL